MDSISALSGVALYRNANIISSITMCTNVLFLTIVECYPTHFYVVGSHYFLKTNALPQTRGLQATVLNVAILAPANVVVFLRDAEDVCFHITRSSDVSLYRTVEYETITYDTN